QTVFEQNNRRFYMHITKGYELSEVEPGYRSQLDKNKLLEASLEGIQFRPFAIKVRNLLVYVTSLGIKSNII
ncbi:18261_t:CDS:2, partial [Gigaspora margarita]